MSHDKVILVAVHANADQASLPGGRNQIGETEPVIGDVLQRMVTDANVRDPGFEGIVAQIASQEEQSVAPRREQIA